MAAGAVPASSQSDGRWKVVFLPSSADPDSAADIASDGIDLTYSFTADGFNYSLTQATVEDKRLTLDQDLSRPGRKTETLEVRYVDTTESDSADDVLAEGTTGFFVIRRGVANSTAIAATDVVDIITFTAGAKRPDAPVENGVDTVSQTIFITAPTQRDVTVGA